MHRQFTRGAGLLARNMNKVEQRAVFAVGRAKLYYLRNRTGKAARIKEKLTVRGGAAAVPEMLPEAPAEEAK